MTEDSYFPASRVSALSMGAVEIIIHLKDFVVNKRQSDLEWEYTYPIPSLRHQPDGGSRK
jgi:hypothetical protein